MNKYITIKKNETVKQVKQTLEHALAPMDNYYNFFPDDVKSGLISFKKYDTDIKTAYFICASKVINTVLTAESHLSILPSLMLEADKLEDTDTVLFCDQLLETFGQLRKALNTFTSQSENALLSASPSYSGLLTILLEFKVRFTEFLNYFNSL